MIYAYDAKQIIESLEISNIVNVMTSLKANHKQLYNDDSTLGFNAICHSNINSHEFKNNTYNLVYYKDSKNFICYSGCGRKSYNIFTLVQKIFNVQHSEDISFYDAVQYVAKICNIEKNEIDGNKGHFNTTTDLTRIAVPNGWGTTFAFTNLGREIKKEELKQKLLIQRMDEMKDYLESETLIELSEYQNVSLNRYYESFDKVSAYNDIWRMDGISLRTMKSYNINFDNWNKEIIIPHYDINDRLIGVRSRLLNKEAINTQGKYRPTYYQGKALVHPTSKNLYGLNKSWKAIQKYKKVIIFEGEKAHLQMSSQLDNPQDNISVSVCGSFISNYQLKLLKNLDVEEIIIAFDKEFIKPNNGTLLQIANLEYIKKYDEYLEKRKRILTKIGKFFDVRFISDRLNDPLLEYKDSPIDKGLDVFFELYNDSILYRKDDFF